MTEGQWATLGDCLILATGVVGVLFVVGYGTLAPWWRTPTGRNIFAVMLVLAANALYFGWIVFFIGHVPLGFYPVRALLFGAMFGVLTHRLILLTRAQLRTRRARRDEDELEDAR